jgi:hypothetical protein
MGIQSPRQITPAPLPAVGNDPYVTTPHRSGRPVEPWRDRLRLVMFVWGALAIGAFVTPLSIDPTTFHWDAILHGEGIAKVVPLLLAAVGALSILLAAIPMHAVPRGALAAVLGLAGLVVPVCLLGLPPWQALIELGGTLALIPGLLARHEYVDATVPRVLVTIGVACALVIFLVPEGGEIPLVMLVKALIDAPGLAKIAPAIQVGTIALVVLALLVWLPAPATAGAKVLAWLVILWPTLIAQIGALLVTDDVGSAIKTRPYAAVMAWAPTAAFFALASYGLATVIGKQLE